MRVRTTVNIDEEVAAQAAKLLQTSSLTQTVNAALREVVAATRRSRLASRVRKGTLSVPSLVELKRVREQQVRTGKLWRK